MEKVPLTKGGRSVGKGGSGGGGGAQVKPIKSSVLSSFTSKVFALQKSKKSTTGQNLTPRSNAQSRRSNSGVSISRQLRFLPVTHTKSVEARPSRTVRRHRCGRSQQRLSSSANGTAGKRPKPTFASGLSWTNPVFSAGDVTLATTAAQDLTTAEITTPTLTSLTMRSVEYNNALDTLLRRGMESLSLISGRNEGGSDGVEGDNNVESTNNDNSNEKDFNNKSQTPFNALSECSSFNSSIADTPCSGNGASLGKMTYDEEKQQYVNNNAVHFATDDVVNYAQSARYNEDTEEKGFQQQQQQQQSLDDGEKASTLLTINQEFKSTSESFLKPTLKTLFGGDGVSLLQHRKIFDSNFSLKYRLRKKWKERQNSTFSGFVESSFQLPSADSELAETFSDALCRSLSLYNAFFLDAKSKRWLVDDSVLARCLDYVGLMGYQRLLPSQLNSLQNLVLSQTSGMVTSPIVSAPSEAGRFVHSVGSYGWALNGKPYSTLAHLGQASLFLSRQEAERWFFEQEYVIGTILSCCAWCDLKSFRDNNDKVPYLSPAAHPIRHTALFALENFSRLGGVTEFVEAWERQIGIVLGTATVSHQRLFRFSEDGLVFTSDMEAGNLARVERIKTGTCQPTFNLWIEPEFNCEQRLWFRFAIAGVRQNCALCLRIVNIQPNTKLYMRNGMRPVWRAGNSSQPWLPVAQCSYRTINNDADGELTFVLIPRSGDMIHVAFCVPYTYADLLCHVVHWHQIAKNAFYNVFFEERILCRTQDGRKLHLLIISSAGGKSSSPRRTTTRHGDVNGSGRSSIVGPYSYFDNGKKVVLMSGRVHPGEVTASHGIHGVITFLLSNDPHALLLREHFIFYIVPMLNPDGVARGHSRLDQNGFNLNRCYKNPIPQKQPTVNALRKLFEEIQQTFPTQFFMYLDFHSHASQSSGFMFGNCLPPSVQHWNLVFPKIVSLHAKDIFSYDLCRFGKNHMTSKEGSSRVLFGGSLVHSYTVELTHFTNNRLFVDGLFGDSGTGGGSNNNSSSNNGGGSAANRHMGMGMSSDGDLWGMRYARMQGRRHGGGTDNNNNNNSGGGGGVTRGEKSGLSLSPQPRSARTAKSHSLSRKHNGNHHNNGVGSSSKRRAENNGNGARTNGGGSDLSNSKGDFLQRINTACVLLQSAEVGRACLLALLDYCAVKNYISPQFAMYGGMERALREVKRGAAILPTPTKPTGNRTQPLFK